MLTLVGLSASSLIVGCSDQQPRGADGTRQSASYCGGTALFPGESLQDWKSYADHFALFTITRVETGSKGDGDPPPFPTATLRIDQQFWSARGAPRLPTVIDMQPAWSYRIGEQFIAPLVRVELAHEWWPVTGCAPMPVHDGRVVAGPGSEQDGPLHAQLDGQTVTQLVGAFRRQEPDPLAVWYADLRPQERVQKVYAAAD